MLGFEAKVLADSVPERGGQRITTMQLTQPRCIHAEFMTHRTHSRNAASSRAIPVERMSLNVQEQPFMPIYWGSNQGGMQAGDEIPPDRQHEAAAAILEHRDAAVALVDRLTGLGLHKQIVNRYLEPWMWITVIATASERGWANFYSLRCHKDAEPHIQKVAYMARDAMAASTPRVLTASDWHLPLTGFDGDESLSVRDSVRVCVGRCARVSYLTHDGVRDPSADIALHDRLHESRHWSPFEHAARPLSDNDTDPSKLAGNLGYGWVQYRKLFPGEFAR